MARIAGVDLPRDKRIEISLTYIYGIGLTTAQKILAIADVNPDTRTRDLTEDEVVRLRDAIDKNAVVEGDLRREVQMNIKRLVDIGWPPPPSRPACSRTEHEEQCAYAQRPEEGRRRQEKVKEARRGGC